MKFFKKVIETLYNIDTIFRYFFDFILLLIRIFIGYMIIVFIGLSIIPKYRVVIEIIVLLYIIFPLFSQYVNKLYWISQGWKK